MNADLMSFWSYDAEENGMRKVNLKSFVHHKDLET